jgi:hypothetical protein
MTARGFRVHAASAITSVGGDLVETLASVRLSVQRVRDSEVVGVDGHLVRAGCVYPVGPHQGGVARQLALFEAPLAAVADHLVGPLGLLVCGPRWPDLDPATAAWGEFTGRYHDYREIPRLLGTEIALRLAKRGCEITSEAAHLGGHTAAFVALLAAPDHGRVILCASACFVDPLGLQLLSGARAAGALPRTFVPGEAAVVLVLEPSRLADADVVVGRTARGERHDALAAAANELLDAIGAPAAPLADVWTDHNGERWRAQAFAFASLRAWGRLGMTPEHRDVARSVGDVGAAAGALQLALAWSAVKHGDGALVTTQDRDGSAAAAFVRGGSR